MHLGKETLDMASEPLKNLKIAILATEGVVQVELTGPRKALEAAGAKTKLVSPKDKEIHGWQFSDWAIIFPWTSALAQRAA
jgi:protease I